MAFRITANVAPGLVRDPHRLARIDRAVGREHMESWHPRGQPHGCIAWQTETRDEALRLRTMLAHAMLATLDHTGTNPEPDALLRSVRIEGRDDGE
jgi:hypothetical protein